MVEQTSPQTTWPVRLGGPPARFAVLSVLMGLAWFPFRLYLDRGDPIPLIIAVSALYGVIWALLIPFISWSSRKTNNQPPLARPDDPAYVRRGALTGLAIGVPYYGALLILCLLTGRFWLYPVAFATTLAIIVVIAVARLRTR
ncbi:hypothetical protein AB0F81_38260 [Actinoplanes sp. NPDC024001]|uniref:hypothetical protein n=1 Tax=Actinoplanes sp. NPDC024001 TaxID=3154598 RepID=UPI0033F82AD3